MIHNDVEQSSRVPLLCSDFWHQLKKTKQGLLLKRMENVGHYESL